MRVGYKWNVGDGKLVRFWEDTWYGNTPLATQYWDLYVLVNEKNKTIAEIWDGQELKCTFRRTFSDELMSQWFELVDILSLTKFSQEKDSLIWKSESKWIYSSKSLYAIVNFRGIQPVYLPVVWSVKIPPRVQGFLWLFSQNKIMTCDNLRTRGIAKPLECVFCKEIESVHHLLFDCLVARLVWAEVKLVFNIDATGYESVAKLWLCAKKCKQLNVVTFAVL